MRFLKSISALFALLIMPFAHAAEFPIPPDQVVNVGAVPGDTIIDLTWDAADDEDGLVTHYKIYYGLNSVQVENDYYDSEMTVPGSATEATLENLENDTMYFIALTAIDDEGNESGNYSVEIAATPFTDEPVVEEPPVEEPAEEPVTPEDPPVEEPVIDEPPVDDGHSAAPDTTPPADAALLAVDTDQMASGNVTLTWKTSLDVDVVDQILYAKKDSGDWDGGMSLGNVATQFLFPVQSGSNYQVRLVTVDGAGNQSSGITKSFSTTLNETGPEDMLSLAALIMFGILVMMFARSAVRR